MLNLVVCRESGGLSPGADRRRSDFGRATPQAFDRIAAALGVVALSPLFLMIAVIMYFRDPGPLFYGHLRMGRNGKPFHCLKFRTMVVNGDAVLQRHLATNPAADVEWRATRKLKSDPRVTEVGRILRRTSMDELPQLINIVRGEMRIVGPRPIVEDEAVHYGDAMELCLSVHPGLTGLWQISGRSDVGYDQRVALDCEYVRTRTFRGDLKIIVRTVGVVFFQKGSY